jgi:hypothetical protein
MNRLLIKLAITAAAGGLFFSNPTFGQIPPPQKRAEHVEITKAPELESAHDDTAIALRDGSRGFEPDGEKSHPAQPDPPGDDFPGSHAGSEASDDLLLQGDLNRQQRRERWGGERCQPVHHTGARREDPKLPSG